MTTEPQPAQQPEREGRYQATAAGQWMCTDCGSLVDYLDGRDIHDRWHDEAGPTAITVTVYGEFTAASLSRALDAAAKKAAR